MKWDTALCKQAFFLSEGVHRKAQQDISASCLCMPVEGCDAVHNNEREARVRHHGSGGHEQLPLVVCVVRACIRHVVQHIVRYQAIPAMRGCGRLGPRCTSPLHAHGYGAAGHLAVRSRWLHRPAHPCSAPLRYLHEPLRPEGALCVNVHGLALATAHVDWQLTGHAQSVAELRLAAAKLPCRGHKCWSACSSSQGDDYGLHAASQNAP